MWERGSIKVGAKTYRYHAKVYDLPSKYGINRGRVSKLSVLLDGQMVIIYDRGWDKQPATQEEKSVLASILNLYC